MIKTCFDQCHEIHPKVLLDLCKNVHCTAGFTDISNISAMSACFALDFLYSFIQVIEILLFLLNSILTTLKGSPYH